MDAQYLAALEQTLQRTFDPSSVKQATASLSKDFYSNPLALPSLLHILQNGQNDQLKQLAAVEARKLVITKWETTDAALKPEIRKALLEGTFGQTSKIIRHSLARVVAAIGEIDLETNLWPDLLPTLISGVQSSDAQSKEMAVYTLFTLLETQNPALKPHQDDFVMLFAGLLLDQTSLEIRVNAVMSLDVLSQFIEEDDNISDQTAANFKNSITGMVLVLKEVIQANDDEKVKDVFNVFNSLIFLDNKLVGEHLALLVQLVAEIAANTHLDAEYRSMALQFLITIVSMRKSKIASNNLGPQLTAVATLIASEEIDAEDELNNEDEENENEENEPPTLALRLVANLSGELPPSQVIIPLFDALPQLVNSPSMFARRAGLLCLGVASSGAPDFFLTQITKILPLVIGGLRDSEALVKVAALKALNQLSSELQEGVAEYHEELLPIIIEIINSATHVMTYKQACYALDGVVEFMSLEAIAQYLEPLMNKLFAMLEQANSSSLKSAVVSAIGSTAFASGKGFIPYFEHSIKALEPYVSNAALTEGMSEDDIELRACTFENISTMARAVGSEPFMAYAQPLAAAAYSSLEAEHARIRESGFAFIANMAKVYGAEFAGSLEQIVPQILKCLEQDEFSFQVDGGEDEYDDDDDDDLNNKFKFNSGITIEKEIASVALAELAAGTGAAFASYVEASIKTLSEQVENSYGMREAAMKAMWRIVISMFKAAQGADFKAPKGVPQQPYLDASILQLVEQVRAITINNLEEEFEFSLVACDLDNLCEALSTIGAHAVVTVASDTSLLENLCVQLMSVLKREHQCQLDDEEPVDDEEDASESDAMLFESALETLIMLAVTLGADFNKIFSSFKDIVVSNVKSKSKNKRVSAIGALAEISAALKGSNPHEAEFMQIFSDRLANDKSLEVKGNAAYGVGIVVEHSTADFSSSYQQVLQMLFHLLSRSDEEAKIDDEETKDVVKRSNANACGCVARMALKKQEAIPWEHVLPPLFAHLPLQAAYEENIPVFKLIIQLYENNNDFIVLQTATVVNIFAQIFQKEADRAKVEKESTLGREENSEKLRQFQSTESRTQVVNLLKFLEQKQAGVVSAHEVLKAVIA